MVAWGKISILKCFPNPCVSFERKGLGVGLAEWQPVCLLMPDAPTASASYFRVRANCISPFHADYISLFFLKWGKALIEDDLCFLK